MQAIVFESGQLEATMIMIVLYSWPALSQPFLGHLRIMNARIRAWDEGS